jgi:hypothetical protein
VNENEAEVEVVEGATLFESVTVIVGGVRSIVHVYPAGVGSTFPAGSTARTVPVWLPAVRPVLATGETQAAKAEPSSAHWKTAVVSGLEKVNVMPVALVRAGRSAVAVVSGGVVSTVHEKEAGVASLFPTASCAYTMKVWLPLVRPLTAAGEAQGAGVPTSAWQKKTAEGSGLANSIDAVARSDSPGGPLVMVVSGAVLSQSLGQDASVSVASHLASPHTTGGLQSVGQVVSVSPRSQVLLPHTEESFRATVKVITTGDSSRLPSSSSAATRRVYAPAGSESNSPDAQNSYGSPLREQTNVQIASSVGAGLLLCEAGLRCVARVSPRSDALVAAGFMPASEDAA